MKSACLQQLIKRGSRNFDVDRIDVVRLALCTRVTIETECECTEWMRTYSMLFAVLTSNAAADSPELAISGPGIEGLGADTIETR